MPQDNAANPPSSLRNLFNRLLGIEVLALPGGAEQRTYRDGTKKWFLNGKLDRADGPAVERADGGKLWYRNGKLHRDGGPASEWFDGSTGWYTDGVLNRTDGGPAIESPDGRKEWMRGGKWDRADGPALVFGDGSEEWYKNGKLHREDGPAQRLVGQAEAWYLEGRRLGKREIAELKLANALRATANKPACPPARTI